MATKNIVPRADKQGQLGTDLKNWNKVLAYTGSFQQHSGSLVPSEPNTFDLGSASYPWKDLHIQSSSIKFYNNAQTQVGQISVDSTGLKVSSPDGGLSIYSGSTFHGEASSSNDLMVMRTGSRTMFSISNAGVLQLGEYQGSTPTPVEGGLLYSGSEFFIGL